MKKIMVVVLLFISLQSFAQSTSQWENIYGGNGNEYGYRVRTCLDQGYIVAGSTSSNGITDGYVVRVDSLGLVMWSKSFVGNNVDIFRSIKQLPDSGYILCGYSNSTGTNGGYDGWVYRINKNGDSLWSKYIGTNDWDFFYDVTPTYDSSFILAGGTYGIGAGDEDMYFVKIDSLGNVLWTKTYGGVKADEARGIIECGDSLIAAVGFSNSLGDTLGDSWIMRLRETNGDTLWSRDAGYPNAEDQGFGICDNFTTGRFFICGYNNISSSNSDAYFGAFFYSGTNQFIYSTGGGLDEMFYGIVARPIGTFAAIGANYTVSNGVGDMYFFHNRGPWVSFPFGGLQLDVGYSIDLAHDDGYIACGYTESFNSYAPNVYLVKIDTSGLSSTVLAIREQPSQSVPSHITIFPNPIQDEAYLNYDSYESIQGQLQMDIYDITGRLVLTIPPSLWQKTTSRNATCRITTENMNVGIYSFIIHDDIGNSVNGKFIITH